METDPYYTLAVGRVKGTVETRGSKPHTFKLVVLAQFLAHQMNHRESEIDEDPTEFTVSSPRMQRLDVHLSKELIKLQDQAPLMPLRGNGSDHEVIREPSCLPHIKRYSVLRACIIE